MADGAITAMAQQMKPAEAFVKEETLEPPDIHADDDKEYLFEQQKVEESASAGPSATVTSNEEEEPPPKRARRTAAVKAAIAMDQESDDDDDSGEPMTKIEDESEDSEGEDHVPAFVDVPSTSADDQPGPSGVGKDGVEAPRSSKTKKKDLLKKYKIKEFSIIIERHHVKPTVIVTNQTKKPKRKYTCYTCWQTFEFKHQVNRHNIMHEKEKKAKNPVPPKPITAPKENKAAPSEPLLYHCEICKVSFGTIDEVKKHPKNNCRFKCGVCSRNYNTVYGFTVHILQHKINCSKPKSSNQYECSDCSASFTDIIQLRSHSLISHKIVARKQLKDDLTCEQCFDVFMSKQELEEHMQFHVELQTNDDVPETSCAKNDVDVEMTFTQSDLDSLSTSITLPKEEAVAEEVDEGVDKSSACRTLKPTKKIPRPHFNCMLCQRIYMDKADYDQHVTDDKCSQIDSCSACGTKFQDNYKYYKHVRQEHGDVFICKYCFEIVADNSSMDKHKLEHFKSFKNLCRICFRILETYDLFCEHLKVHLSL